MLEGKADLDALSTLKMHFAGLSAGGEGPTGAGELNSGMLDAFQDALSSKADKELVNVSLDQLWAEVRACQKNVRQAREEVERVREEEVRPLYDRADAADRALEGLEERKADRSRVRKDLEERADLEDHLAHQWDHRRGRHIPRRSGATRRAALSCRGPERGVGARPHPRDLGIAI